MNKLKLLIAPLLVLPFAISCGGNNPNPIEFFLTGEQVVEDKSATIYVDWNPSDHSIKFDSFTFVSQPAKDNIVSFDKESEARPMPVTITFTDTITEDISGTLSFSYEDITAKTNGNGSIAFTVPSPFVVNQSEYDHAISLEGIEFLQVEKFNEGGKRTINEFSPTVYHMSSENTRVDKYIVKEGNVYNKYHRVDGGEWRYTPNVDPSDFLTPQTHNEIKPKRYLDGLGIVYGQNLNYDASKGIYSARVEIEGTVLKVDVGFYKKKIISFEYSFEDADGDRYEYSYDEITPPLPPMPSTL